MSFLKTAGDLFLAALPSLLKIPLYRLLYGYTIGRDVRIGLGSALVAVRTCRIGDHVRIGRFNLFMHVNQLEIADHARIGLMNLFRGGRRISIGPHANIIRLNVLNAILQPDAVNPVDSIIELGAGVVITTGHWLDFTDRFEIGPHTVIGGRNSSFWTHNRQRTRAITFGHHCYFGSDVHAAPGVEVPPCCVVAIGSVLTGRLNTARSLIAGNPARVIRPLGQRDLFFVTSTIPADTSNPAPLADQTYNETATA